MVPETAEHRIPECKQFNVSVIWLYNLITNRLLTPERTRVLNYTGMCNIDEKGYETQIGSGRVRTIEDAEKAVLVMLRSIGPKEEF